MLKDTFDKITTYREKVSQMLVILQAVDMRLGKFMDKYVNTIPIEMPRTIQSERLCYDKETLLYRKKEPGISTYLKIPSHIDMLGGIDYMDIDQLFDVIAHLDEELTTLFNAVIEIFTYHASKVVEEFRESAVAGLM